MNWFARPAPKIEAREEATAGMIAEIEAFDQDARRDPKRLREALGKGATRLSILQLIALEEITDRTDPNWYALTALNSLFASGADTSIAYDPVTTAHQNQTARQMGVPDRRDPAMRTECVALYLNRLIDPEGAVVQPIHTPANLPA
jgi:hypothetical protein